MMMETLATVCTSTRACQVMVWFPGRCSGAMTGTSLGLHPVNINACPRVKDRRNSGALIGMSPGQRSMTEYVAPAPAVYYATPAPPIEFVTPSPVIEYSAPAPPVTCFTPSPQFPTMADLITGVTTSVDDACPKPRSCTEHFDLTADESQDECLADGIPSYEMACRVGPRHRTES